MTITRQAFDITIPGYPAFTLYDHEGAAFEIRLRSGAVFDFTPPGEDDPVHVAGKGRILRRTERIETFD